MVVCKMAQGRLYMNETQDLFDPQYEDSFLLRDLGAFFAKQSNSPVARDEMYKEVFEYAENFNQNRKRR